jgi:YggT family protein
MSVFGLAIQILCWALIIAILVRIVFSWIDPTPYPRNSLHRLAWDISEPVLRPVRNFLPPAAGFDFSPTIVLFVLFMISGAVRGL